MLSALLWYNGVMIAEWIKEWAIPLSAGITLLLALAAFWAIWQNYQFHKRERNERLLNEIIEWVTELPKFLITMKFEFIQADNEEKLRLYLFARFAQDLNNLNAFIGRYVYILNISSSFDSKLQLAVQKLIEDILSYRDFFNKWFKILENNSFDPKREDFDKAVEVENTINTSALDVIQEATKIKTRDIS